MTLEDRIWTELQRAAALAGRPGIVVPSQDLDEADRLNGNRQSTHKAISRLARAGRLTNVRRDLVILPDATGRVLVDLPALVDVVAPMPYVITGGRALQRHDLTDQHFFSVVVLVPVHVSNFSYRNETTDFLTTGRGRIWGWLEGERPRIASPERAIIDALSHPRYGVSFQQGLNALVLAARRDQNFMERLIAGVRRYHSAATARRVGLLVDRLFGADAAEPFHELIGARRSPVPLRSTGMADGPVDSTWRVIVNATIEPEKVGA